MFDPRYVRDHVQYNDKYVKVSEVEHKSNGQNRGNECGQGVFVYNYSFEIFIDDLFKRNISYFVNFLYSTEICRFQILSVALLSTYIDYGNCTEIYCEYVFILSRNFVSSPVIHGSTLYVPVFMCFSKSYVHYINIMTYSYDKNN